MSYNNESRISKSYAVKLLNEFNNLPVESLGKRLGKGLYREWIGYPSESKFAAEVVQKCIEYVNEHPEVGRVESHPRKRSTVLILEKRIVAIMVKHIIVRERKD